MKQMTKQQLIDGINFMYRYLSACEETSIEHYFLARGKLNKEYFRAVGAVLKEVADEMVDYFGPLA